MILKRRIKIIFYYYEQYLNMRINDYCILTFTRFILLHVYFILVKYLSNFAMHVQTLVQDEFGGSHVSRLGREIFI